MIQREEKLEKADRDLKYVKDKRNETETYMYTTKEKLSHDYKDFINENEKVEILTLFEETVNWFETSLDTYNKEKVEEKYHLVTAKGNSVFKKKRRLE